MVEDDPQVRAMLIAGPRARGLRRRRRHRTRPGPWRSCAPARPDLLLLDLLLPDVDGLELCRRLRRAGDRVPILMLTARDTVSDRIDGLEAGADDYLVKPFSTAELVARVRALLRRARDRSPGTARRYGDLVLDSSTHEVRRGERALRLTIVA